MGEALCVAVAMWESGVMGGNAVCGGCGGYKILIHCVLGLSLVFRIFRKKRMFKKFTAAKAFASAHFAKAH